MTVMEAQQNLIRAQNDLIQVLMSTGSSKYCNIPIAKSEEKAVRDNKIPLFSEYSEVFLQRKKSLLRTSSYHNYLFQFKMLIAEFGQLRLDEIRTKHLQDFIVKNLDRYAVKTIKEYVARVKEVLLEADRDEYPVSKIKKLQYPEQNGGEYRVLTDDEYNELYAICLSKIHFENRSKNCILVTLISMTTGMRIGEACGLRWDDIDLSNREIKIQRTVSRVYDPKTKQSFTHIGPPKTKDSVRTIPIPENLYVILQKICDKTGYVCSASGEKPNEPRTARASYVRLLKKMSSGVKMPFHGLRHTYATRCIAAGMNPKVVARLLGHRDCDITLNLYTSCTKSMMSDAVDMLNKAYSQSTLNKILAENAQCGYGGKNCKEA